MSERSVECKACGCLYTEEEIEDHNCPDECGYHNSGEVVAVWEVTYPGGYTSHYASPAGDWFVSAVIDKYGEGAKVTLISPGDADE